MNEDTVVLQVLDRLDALGIPYMLVGSYASSAYGRPRGSYGADIVAEAPPERIDEIARSFQADFVLDPESAARDLREGRMFNLIPRSGFFKVDIIPRRTTAFAYEEFRRRRPIAALGRSVWMSSPEDVILSKLWWHRKGGEVSERQIEDARDVHAIQASGLDENYLDHWASEIGVRDLLDRIRGK